SAGSNVVILFTVPGVLLIGDVTAGLTCALVMFTVPATNGGNTITSYSATSIPGGIVGSCFGSGACVITVFGLTAGTNYSFTVHRSEERRVGKECRSCMCVVPYNVRLTQVVDIYL